MAKLFDADALLQAMKKADEADPDLATCWSRGSIRRIIDGLPTTEAAPVVHGRWEEWWPGISLIMTGEEMLYRCSVCDAKYPDVESYKCCPNCGARMDLGGE